MTFAILLHAITILCTHPQFFVTRFRLCKVGLVKRVRRQTMTRMASKRTRIGGVEEDYEELEIKLV